MEKLSRDEMYLLGLKLEPKSLLTFCQTDKFFYEKVCKNDNFWKEKLKRDYPLLEDFFKIENLTWKKFYLKMIYYISKLEEEYGVPYFPIKYHNPENFYLMRGTQDFYNRAMIKAAEVGNLDLVKKMREKIEKLLKYQYGRTSLDTAIYFAAKGGYLDIVKYLVEEGATDLNYAALVAAEKGYLEILKYLLFHDKKDSINMILVREKGKKYPDILEFMEGK